MPTGSKLSSSLEIRVISSGCSSCWRLFTRALEWSNSCTFGSFTAIGHFGSFQRLLHTCMIMYDIVWSFYNERSICEAMWLRRYGFWHCISLLDIAGQQDRSISLDSECPKKCHRTTYSYIIVTSHVKLETTWLSLASWDISASYFSSRPRIRIISSLHSSRSCKSETNHEHHKVEQISRSAFENWFCLDWDAWVWVGVRKYTDNSYMISR